MRMRRIVGWVFHLIQHAQFKVAFDWPRAPSSNILFYNIFQRHTIWKFTSKLSVLRTSSLCIDYFKSIQMQVNNSFELILRLSANHWFKFWKLSARKRRRRILKTINSHWSNKTPFEIRFFPDNFWCIVAISQNTLRKYREVTLVFVTLFIIVVIRAVIDAKSSFE